MKSIDVDSSGLDGCHMEKSTVDQFQDLGVGRRCTRGVFHLPNTPNLHEPFGTRLKQRLSHYFRVQTLYTGMTKNETQLLMA